MGKKKIFTSSSRHQAGAKTVRKIVKCCAARKIEVLTLFAFSSENWRRPDQEVKFLINLFITLLKREVKELHKQNVQFSIVGDRSPFDKNLQHAMYAAEELTANNTGLKLVVAINYGGRWTL